MSVNPGDSLAEQTMLIQKAENFVLIGGSGAGQAAKIIQEFLSRPDISARDFSNHERMYQDLAVQKELTELRIILTEMLHPNGGVRQDHRPPAAARLRGAAWKFG